jgi:hypothetical protein
MTASVQRRVIPVNNRTSLIFTEISGARNKVGVGITLSIKSDKLAETLRLPPLFGAALESAIKEIAGRK